MLASILACKESWKFRVHMIEIALIVAAIILSIVRFNIYTPPPTRSNAVAITMGFKSLFFIAYQLLTEHTYKFSKWASTKANMVLNCMEPVFWLAVLVVAGLGAGRDTGAAAACTALVLVLAIVLEFLSIWMAVCSVKIHRAAKRSPTAYGAGTAFVQGGPRAYEQSPKGHSYPPASMQERRPEEV